jgi:hypothetical protein
MSNQKGTLVLLEKKKKPRDFPSEKGNCSWVSRLNKSMADGKEEDILVRRMDMYMPQGVKGQNTFEKQRAHAEEWQS